MNFRHIRNKVKMLLTKEQKMLILQFVVVIFFTIFTVLRIYKRFFLHYLQYLQGLGTFVLFLCCLLSKRCCC